MQQVQTVSDEQLLDQITTLKNTLSQISPEMPEHIIESFKKQFICLTELQFYRRRYGRITYVSMSL